MPRRSWFTVLLLIGLVFAAAGCGKEERQLELREPPSSPSPTEEGGAEAVKKTLRVVVPDEVKGHWKAVKIAVFDKDAGREEVYTVDIGSEFVVGDTTLSLAVTNFLPAFIMDGTTMTSASNDTKNPAAQIVIKDEGKEIFRGWLFSLYPGTHAFQHPRFSFSLVDFVAAG